MKIVKIANIKKLSSEQDNLVIDKTIANLQSRLNEFWIWLNENFGADKKRFLSENAPKFVVQSSEFMQNITNTTSHPDDVNFLDLWYSNNLTAKLSQITKSQVLFETLAVKNIKLKPLIHNDQKIQWLPLNKKFVIDRNYFDKLSDDIKLFITNNKDKNISDILIMLCENNELNARSKYKISKVIVASVFGLNGDFDNNKTKIINSELVKYIYSQILWKYKLPNRINEYMINNIQNIIKLIWRQLANLNLDKMTKWQKDQYIYMNIKHWLIDYVNQNNPEVANIFDTLWLMDDTNRINTPISNQSDNSAFGPASIHNIYKSFANIINDEEFGDDFMKYMVKYMLDSKWWNPVELGMTNDGWVIYIYPDWEDFKIIKQSKSNNIYIWKWLEDLKYLLTGMDGNTLVGLSWLQIMQFTNVFDAIHSILNGSMTIWSERWMREIVLYILSEYSDLRWISAKYVKYIHFIKNIKINKDNSIREWIANIDTDKNWLYPSFTNRFADSVYICLLWPEIIWSREFTRSYQNAEIAFDLNDHKEKLIKIFELPIKINEKVIEIAEIY